MNDPPTFWEIGPPPDGPRPDDPPPVDVLPVGVMNDPP